MGRKSELPLYFSEAGADSFMAAPKDDYQAGDNQTAQADATRIILNQIFEKPNIVNGVTLFSFTDGWWKAGNPNQQDQGAGHPLVLVCLMTGHLTKNTGVLST